MKATRPIGDSLDTTAQARMHFHALTHEQQAQAIQRLAATGHALSTIAQATGLSIEQIQLILTGVKHHA